LKSINERLNVVEYFYNNRELRDELIKEIKQVGDLERLISKIGLQKANPREITQLKRALYVVEKLKTLTDQETSEALRIISEQLNICQIIRDKMEQTLRSEERRVGKECRSRSRRSEENEKK